MHRSTFFIFLFSFLILIGCGQETNPKTSLQSVIPGANGFSCDVSFSAPLVKDTEEFTITLRPTGKFLGAPTQVGSPTGLSVVSTTTEADVVTIKAKAKFSFIYTAAVQDSRGRRTQCSKGMQIIESK